ncbi:MAG: response regulator [Candidatus Melainabacteria bacterium]|nr:response regulator [Candidatus Melainabacteria bacterium]
MRKILLVEDNNDDIVLIKLALEDSKINSNLLVANNGKAALDLLNNIVESQSKLPDIILIDINLPKMSGLEVLNKIKSKTITSHVPVVIFTSSDSISDMKYCYQNGADLFIRKPNNIKDLKEIMLYIKEYSFKS